MNDKIELTVLGCGSSFGVPLSHDIWGSCDSSNPKNYRTRPSIHLKKGKKSLIIDTSPDLRQQLINNKINNLNSVIFSHSHADHIHGINDLRIISLINKKKINIYADKNTLNELKKSFSYLFHKSVKYGYDPILISNLISESQFELDSFKIKVIRQNHGNIDSYGFVFDDKIAYNLDVKYFYDETYIESIQNIDCWILGCLRYESHPSHANYSEVIKWAKHVSAKRTYLSHMTALLDYDKEFNKLSKYNIFPAYDGLKLII